MSDEQSKYPELCPKRPSGGPCVGPACAWWDEYEVGCAVLSIAHGLSEVVEKLNVLCPRQDDINLDPFKTRDDDVPF
jgi:hypothetical protein